MKKNKSVFYYLFVLLAIVFLFFTNDFGLADIRKTAIITGLAIDAEGENYTVTADLAVPQSSSGEQTIALQVSGSGRTVSEALEKIGAKTGWSPKLVYCKIIILGGETVKNNVFACLDYFLRNEYFSPNCLLACTDSSAGEILSVKTPADNVTSLALQKILSTKATTEGGISSITLKDFAVGYYGDSKSGFMPILRLAQVSETGSGESGGEAGGGEEGGSQTAAQTQGSNSGGGSGGQSGSSEQKAFDYTSTALFYEGKKVGELDEEETFAFNLLRLPVRMGTLTVTTETVTHTLSIKHNKSKIKFSVEDNKPQLKLSLTVLSSIDDANVSQNVLELSQPTIVPEELRSKAEEALKKVYESIYAKSKETHCDVFYVIDKLKRFQNDYYEAYKRDILDLVQPEFAIKINSSKK